MSTTIARLRAHKLIAGVGVVVALGAVAGCDEPADERAVPVSGPSASSSAEVRALTLVPSPTSVRTSAPRVVARPSAPPKRTLLAPTAKPVVTVKASPRSTPKTSPKPVVRTSKPSPVATKSRTPTATTYQNCAALNIDYPHGVGLPGATDHTSGSEPVTTFTRNAAVYNANTGRDRDNDNIACEQA